MRKNNKAFTFVELIVAMVILVIVAAGVYAAFLSAAKFSGTFRHKVMAVIGAQGILEQTRATTSNHPSSSNYLAPVPVNPGDPGDDVSSSAAFDQLRNKVVTGSLTATRTVTGTGAANPDVDLDSGYLFRRITTTVQWTERQI